jgi:hypothetical protein
VTFELRLLDAQGRTVWTQAYDSGSQRMAPALPTNELAIQKMHDDIMRLAHEGAWRLMQQAVVDLRDWVAGERLKAREL